tara:strand:+ start:509 stop:1516 length:1008 start_codon:yes stop_codon:yes gene_type:complete
MIYLFLLTIFIFLLIFLCKKNNFLLDKIGDKHQEFIPVDKTPLIGGVIIFLSMIYLMKQDFNIFGIVVIVIFFIGFFSDLKKIISPSIRLVLQFIAIVICLYYSNTTLASTRILYLDYLLSHYLFSIFFTSFCILIIINGTNFMDGVNTLVVGYYIIISIILLLLENRGFQISFNFELSSIFFVLIIIFIFNLFNKLYLGDSGSYLLGFIFGLGLINFYQSNLVSPFFIILLLWYPGFENFFSILRKSKLKKSPIEPDTNHLHQLMFYYFNKKNLSAKLSSSLVGLIINFYNLGIIYVALLNPAYTQIQLFLIFLNVTVYSYIYIRLLKFKISYL